MQIMTPITSCYLCRHIPLDNSYKDTLTFENSTQQFEFFRNKAKFAFEDLSPIDINSRIKIPKVADELFDCNYIVFRNSNFTNKYFYAFIKQIEFVNANVSNVYFEIDVMQTWYFEMNIMECFVEREHVNSDKIGEHTIDEGIETGDYVETLEMFPNLGKMGVMVSYARQKGEKQNGIYYGLGSQIFDIDEGVGALNDFLSYYYDKPEDILNINMFPTDFHDSEKSNKAVTKTFYYPKEINDLDGYVPKNNKMRTYPYTFLHGSNSQGQTCSYRWEWFPNANCNFTIYGATSPQPELVLLPDLYNGVGDCTDYKMTLSGFPMCAWASDTYRAFLAQNATSLGISALASVAGLTASAVSGNPIGAIAGVSGLISIDKSIKQAQISPTQAHGSQGNNTLFSAGYMRFRFVKKSIKADYARMIDDFFTMYGYKVCRLKKPNITGRKYWNYVKTTTACITGSIPFNDLAKIKGIFNNGVTFWHGDCVGCYGLSNEIV